MWDPFHETFAGFLKIGEKLANLKQVYIDFEENYHLLPVFIEVEKMLSISNKLCDFYSPGTARKNIFPTLMSLKISFTLVEQTQLGPVGLGAMFWL